MTNSLTPLETAVEPTGIEAEVCQDIAARQQLGLNKYGVSVAESPLALEEWMQHGYLEILDASIYMKRAIRACAEFRQQLSTLRQNSVPKSVWDETHAKYLEECEKVLKLQTENEGLKESVRLANGTADLAVKHRDDAEQDRKSLEAMTKERDELKRSFMQNECDIRAVLGKSHMSYPAINAADDVAKELQSTRAENVDDQTALEAIDHVTSDDFCEELEMRGDLDGDLKIAHEKLSLIYKVSHSQCRGHSCYGVHESWRELKHEIIEFITTPPTTTDNSKENVK